MSIYTPRLAEAISDKLLNLILMPTEYCNFRCTYCYETFKIGKMSPKVVRGVKNLLTERMQDLDFLIISWFGGEPLLAQDVIESISDHILSLSKSFSNVRYRADITSNGYFLTKNVFRKLLHWNIRNYQIAFDGTKEQHDRKRILAKGKPTFDRLWKNLNDIKTVSGDFAVTVRLHLDRDNYGDAPEFLAEFKRDFGNDSRFTLYVRELSCITRPIKQILNVFELNEAISIIDNIRRLAESEGINIRVPERKNHVCQAACYAAKLNSFVVRANGSIGKCTVVLDRKVNDVGKILEDGHLTLNRINLMKWARGLASGNPTEIGCPMLNIDSANVLLPGRLAV